MSSMPATPKPFSIKIGSLNQNRVSVAHNLRRIVTSRGGHRWTFSVVYPGGMGRADIAALWAFLVSQGGQVGSFDFAAPYQSARGSMAGAPVVDGTGQAGNVLNLKNFTPSQAGVLVAGDYIRIDGYYKSYLVVADVDSAVDGTAAVQIHPALQSSPADGSAISADGIFRCALTSDTTEIDMNDVLHYGLQIDLVEVLD